MNQFLQCSCAPSRPVSWERGIEARQLFAVFRKVKRTDGILLKHTSCLRILVPLIHGSKSKSLRISSFKGVIQDDPSGGRASGLKSIRSSVKLSYLPQDSKDTLYDVSKMQNIHAPATFESDRTTAEPLAIQNLFRSWLTLLRMPSPYQEAEGTSLNEIVEAEHKIQNSGRGEILKMVWCNFLGLHATIKIPAMIFIPMYLAINMKYGLEVGKELTPLWIGGPLLVALYLNMLRLITSLYIFSFRQSVKVLKESPMAYDYVACGKLKEMIRGHLWTPMVDFWNLGYIEMSKRTWKDLQLWLVDKYLDYVESVWPSYCKLIRFLKRTNFI